MFPAVLPSPRHPADHEIPVLRQGMIGPGWIAERFTKALKSHTSQQLGIVFKDEK